MFVGFDEDGGARYDSKEAAIERAKQMLRFYRANGNAVDDTVAVQRDWAPLWFAHLVRWTPLEWLAYREIKVEEDYNG